MRQSLKNLKGKELGYVLYFVQLRIAKVNRETR